MVSEPFWTGSGKRGLSHFHVDEDCSRLEGANIFERDRDYVEWHDLEPCPWCHPDEEPETTAGRSISTLARDLKGGGQA